MSLRTSLFVALASLALVAPLLGQGSQTGVLTGAVVGTTGDAIPGVQVTLDSPSLQGERQTFSGPSGKYVFRGLLPGDYTVTFELEGMSTVRATADIEVGLTSTLNATLEVSSLEAVIEVSGAAPNALENRSTGGNYDEKVIDTLPITRTLAGIATLAPGVTGKTQLNGQSNVAGAFSYDNLVMVDGVDINDSVFGTPNALFFEDSIEETQIITSGASAEYGRFSGGVINAITKFGGNDFEASLRADFTNPRWRDETPFEVEQGQDRPNNLQEVYQGYVSGRIVRDKLWFFGGVRQQNTSINRTLLRTGIQFNETGEQDRPGFKLTGNIANRHTLQGSYIENDDTRTRRSATTASTLDTIVTPSFPNELLVGRWNGVLSSSIFAEAQYSEKDFGFRNTGGTSREIRDSPFQCWQTRGSGRCLYNAPLFDATDPEDRNNEQFAASVSWFRDTPTVGSHDVKFGYENFANIRTGGNSNSATDWVFFQDPVLNPDGTLVLDGNGKATPVWDSAGLGVFFEAFRGSEVEIETQSFYINDRIALNDHWSFNLGARFEDIGSGSTQNIEPVSTERFVPRFGATYDVKGDGKHRIDATFGQYSGGYNVALFTQVTNTGNASYVFGFYTGPPGQGIDHDPGFDANNYFFVAGNIPTLNIIFDDDLKSPVSEEFTLAYGLQLPRGGYLKATYVNRDLDDIVENFTRIQDGTSTGSIQGLTLTLDNIVFENTDLADRTYEAVTIQGAYRLTDNWSIQGHWTHQLENDGNYEGEAGQGIGPGLQGIGEYPEITDARNFASGRLDEFQEDRARIWTTYNFGLGRAGNLAASLLFNYDTGNVFSFTDDVPWTATQLAQNPGYLGVTGAGTQGIFFGERGTGEFGSASSFDVSLNYSVPLFQGLDLWVKGEVRNVLNSDAQTSGNISVDADFTGPVDGFGRPLNFTLPTDFMQPNSDADFQIPREYRFSVGFRF